MSLIATNLTSNDIERETPRAYLVRLVRGQSALVDKFVWVPKSHYGAIVYADRRR